MDTESLIYLLEESNLKIEKLINELSISVGTKSELTQNIISSLGNSLQIQLKWIGELKSQL